MITIEFKRGRNEETLARLQQAKVWSDDGLLVSTSFWSSGYEILATHTSYQWMLNPDRIGEFQAIQDTVKFNLPKGE